MRKSIMYVGMDQHKESIEMATADEGREGEVRRYGFRRGRSCALFMKRDHVVITSIDI